MRRETALAEERKLASAVRRLAVKELREARGTATKTPTKEPCDRYRRRRIRMCRRSRELDGTPIGIVLEALGYHHVAFRRRRVPFFVASLGQGARSIIVCDVRAKSLDGRIETMSAHRLATLQDVCDHYTYDHCITHPVRLDHLIVPADYATAGSFTVAVCKGLAWSASGRVYHRNWARAKEPGL